MLNCFVWLRKKQPPWKSFKTQQVSVMMQGWTLLHSKWLNKIFCSTGYAILAIHSNHKQELMDSFPSSISHQTNVKWPWQLFKTFSLKYIFKFSQQICNYPFYEAKLVKFTKLKED